MYISNLAHRMLFNTQFSSDKLSLRFILNNESNNFLQGPSRVSTVTSIKILPYREHKYSCNVVRKYIFFSSNNTIFDVPYMTVFGHILPLNCACPRPRIKKRHFLYGRRRSYIELFDEQNNSIYGHLRSYNKCLLILGRGRWIPPSHDYKALYRIVLFVKQFYIWPSSVI